MGMRLVGLPLETQIDMFSGVYGQAQQLSYCGQEYSEPSQDLLSACLWVH